MVSYLDPLRLSFVVQLLLNLSEIWFLFSSAGKMTMKLSNLAAAEEIGSSVDKDSELFGSKCPRKSVFNTH